MVEERTGADQIVASHMTNGKADRTRPLCPYPQVATYKGTGSTDDAANLSASKCTNTSTRQCMALRLLLVVCRPPEAG